MLGGVACHRIQGIWALLVMVIGSRLTHPHWPSSCHSSPLWWPQSCMPHTGSMSGTCCCHCCHMPCTEPGSTAGGFTTVCAVSEPELLLQHEMHASFSRSSSGKQHVASAAPPPLHTPGGSWRCHPVPWAGSSLQRAPQPRSSLGQDVSLILLLYVMASGVEQTAWEWAGDMSGDMLILPLSQVACTHSTPMEP